MKRRAQLDLAKLYPSFPVLVWEMVRDSAEQTVQAMADRTKIDHATLLKWMRGRTKVPESALVIQWARNMGLHVEQVLDLASHDAIRYAMGIPVPLPKVDLRPGPRPGAARRPLPIAGGSSDDGTLAIDFAEAISFLYDVVRRWWPLRWGWLTAHAGAWCAMVPA